MAEVLEQSEVDALLAAMDEGQIASNKRKTVPSQRRLPR